MTTPESVGPLQARVALVYDATTPAGAAAARELARLGAWTACALRERHEEGQSVVDAIRMNGGRALLLAGDPAQPREAWTLLQRLEAEWGPVNLVALLPSPGAPPSALRAALVNLVEAGVGTLAQDARFLLAVPTGLDAAAFTACAPAPMRIRCASGDAADTNCGATLARLALDV